MTKRKDEKQPYENRLYLDMPFEEALERFVGVESDQLRANLAKSKKKKPPGGKKPSDDIDAQSVVRLRDKRKVNNG